MDRAGDQSLLRLSYNRTETGEREKGETGHLRDGKQQQRHEKRQDGHEQCGNQTRDDLGRLLMRLQIILE